MKNKLLFPLVLLLIIGLVAVACASAAPEEPNPTNSPTPTQPPEELGYRDGTYAAYSDGDKSGCVKAVVTIANGRIADVQLTEVQGTGFEKDEGYVYETWHEAIGVLPARFVEANSHIIEGYSGATGTSTKAMAAVERALKRAEGVTGPFNGTFFGFSDIDARNARNLAWVTVEEGKIVQVVLEEYSNVYEKVFKGEDYELPQWHEARAELPGRFIAANSAEVDAYTGATSSSGKWMQAVERALEKAFT
ncbi:MAG: FMN-binding protein [Dehalococcoidia bacterium]|nr:FMN-binding protein [Dehalococcoidia bacterium]